MKNAESKSQQRRIKEQTGQDVPLSDRAAAALAEHLPAEAELKDALRPGHAPTTHNFGRAHDTKKAPAKTPILGLDDSLNPPSIEMRFQVYRDAERDGASKLMAKIDKDLGAKVREADKVRREKFEEAKFVENRALQIARNEYTLALRAAKGALDSANAAIRKEGELSRETHRAEFNNAVAPINTELETTKKQIVATYEGKLTAAIAEMTQVLKLARAKEEKRVADLKAKMEAEAAAKAAEVPAEPIINNRAVVPALAGAAAA